MRHCDNDYPGGGRVVAVGHATGPCEGCEADLIGAADRLNVADPAGCHATLMLHFIELLFAKLIGMEPFVLR